MFKLKLKKSILLMFLPVLITGTGCSGNTVETAEVSETAERAEPEVVALDMPGIAVEEINEGLTDETADETETADEALPEENVKTEEDQAESEYIEETEKPEETENAEEPVELQEYWFQNTKIAMEHSQLITVGDARGTTAPFSLYEKDEEGSWQLIFSVTSYIGRHGYNDDRHQGDETTPTGVYHFTRAFGIADDPGCTIGYTKVNEHHYWVGNSDSPYYNTMISDLDTSDFSKKASEHLIAYTQPYQYCLNISFNTEQTPGRGSAIFLHCYSERPDTGGCVAIPQKYMKQLLCRLKTDCVIAIDCDVDDMNGEVH